jgi:serine/threonine-protein kinase
MQPEQLGPYRIQRQIGRGGMGTVYAGVDASTGEAAAVKVLAAALAMDDDFRARFEIEIETLRKLRHENIVRLLGWGEQDGVLFYAMELVDGPSLEDELRAGRRFEWADVKELAVQVCAALKHAHDRGVVHRDIKPANLLLARDGKVKLSDFGIAKLFGSVGATAGVLGTAEYMAPEQADGRPVGHRGDLYSLGAVLYTLLAGRPPFVANSVPQLLQMQRFAQPEPVRRFNKSVPIEVEAIVMQLLEKDPERRIPNATVLARRLEATFRGLATLAVREQQAEGGDDVGFQLGSSPATPDVGRNPADVEQTRIATRPAGAPPPASPSDLTKATAMTKAAESAGESDSAVRRAQRRFTTVDEQPVGGDADVAPAHWLSPQTALFLIGLVAVGLVVAYFLQPPSADTLYERVKQRIATGQSGLLACEEDIHTFRKYYSADHRAREMERHLDDIELINLENRLERQSKMAGPNAKLGLIERTFLEALRLETLDPPACVEMLEALSQLYEDGRGAPTPNAQKCVLLAASRAARLKPAADSFIEAHEKAQRERLDYADEIDQAEPETARKIRQAVVHLYGSKPWAAAWVERAKKALPKAAPPQPAREPID